MKVRLFNGAYAAGGGCRHSGGSAVLARPARKG